MRADLKLQWRIVIAIFEVPNVRTREKTSLSLRFSIPAWGEEEEWLEKKSGSFLCSSIAISFVIEFLLEYLLFICRSA